MVVQNDRHASAFFSVHTHAQIAHTHTYAAFETWE